MLTGDAREVLKTVPDGFCNTCVCSPPYFGLRSYLDADAPEKAQEIGTEETPEQFIENLVSVFQQVRRVLRNDGTLWVNIGDSYAGSSAGGYRPGFVPGIGLETGTGHQHGALNRNGLPKIDGCKTKDLIGIPWMLAFALRADGWYLRQEIIWHKPNAMPESVKDRPTRNHEQVFLLAKSPQYFYDADAIKEQAKQPVGDVRLTGQRKAEELKRTIPVSSGPLTFSTLGTNQGADTRNKRSVWTVTTQPDAESHFAMFPPDLIRPMIRAGCPLNGVVLDPFGGGGTTGVVSLQEGRKFIGCELNPKNTAIAYRRANRRAANLTLSDMFADDAQEVFSDAA
jgi:DNA modification methylase